MISFLIEFSLLLGFFGLIDGLILNQFANYDFRRKFLVISSFISITLPLIPTALQSKSLVIFSQLLPTVELVAEGLQNTAYTTNINTSSFSLSNALLSIYLLITLFILIRFIRSVFQIVQIFKNHNSTSREGNIIYTSVIKNPCSFFKTIFLPSDQVFSQEELNTIIKHETIHIELDHSIEKIYFEVFKIVFWWHPVSWIYTRKIELVHELQVDEQMQEQMSSNKYKEILLQLIINPPRLRLTHSFSSHIKKRIQTMNQKKKKFSFIQLFSLCAVLFTATFFIHSCADATEEKYGENIEEVNLVAANPNVSYYDLNVVDTITTFDFDTYEETIEIVESVETIYRTPEDMPIFPGCDHVITAEELKSCSTDNLLKFIYTNIQYPAQARTKGIEGMVVVKFVVNERGTIERRAFTKTLGYGIEETVNEMLDKMQNEIKWIPGKVDGKNVNVEYTLPVKFKLES